MIIEYFDESWFADLSRPGSDSSKFNNGQVTIVGGSSLFFGSPILALKVTTRVVGMVYFSSFFTDKEAADLLKAGLQSFIWVKREDLPDYIRKSDAVLVGPGMMRSHANVHDGGVVDSVGNETREITLRLFEEHKNTRFVVDAGSLQVVRPEELPKGCVITPNAKEFTKLFGEEPSGEKDELVEQVRRKAEAFGIVILHKGVVPVVSDGKRVVVLPVLGINVGKGAVGDIIAGLVTGFYAKNEPVLAAAMAAFLVGNATERLYKRQGDMFNSDDLANEVARVYGEHVVFYRK